MGPSPLCHVSCRTMSVLAICLMKSGFLLLVPKAGGFKHRIFQDEMVVDLYSMISIFLVVLALDQGFISEHLVYTEVTALGGIWSSNAPCQE